MSKLSLSVFLNAYDDNAPSNAPSRNPIKWARDLSGLMVSNPKSEDYTIAPGETRVLFSGVRTTLQDSTTEYSIALKPLTSNTYILSAASGTLPNFRTPRAITDDATTRIVTSLNGPLLTLNGASIGITAGQFIGQIAGMTTDVTITANVLGTAGNISLPSDGTSTITHLIAAWNTGNPGNTLTLSSGDGTQIPTSGSFVLTGGSNSTAANFSAAQVGDYVTIGSNFNLLNQGTFQIVAATATTLSVANLTGVVETVALGSGFATQLQVFGPTGVQIGDTLIISSGFSPISWGSYQITAVYANSLEFYSTAVLPQESSIMTEVAIYSNAKNLIYMESDGKVSLTVNGIASAVTIEPFALAGCCNPNGSNTQAGNGNQPGMILLKSTIYSLSVTNNGLNPANVFLAAVE